MPETIYKSYGKPKKSRLKKILTVVLVICVVFLLAVGVLGIIKGSDSEQRRNVSDAIAENTQLKSRISELEEQVAQLEEQVNALSGELEAIPTQVPEEPVPQEPQEQSPRQQF